MSTCRHLTQATQDGGGGSRWTYCCDCRQTLSGEPPAMSGEGRAAMEALMEAAVRRLDALDPPARRPRTFQDLIGRRLSARERWIFRLRYAGARRLAWWLPALLVAFLVALPVGLLIAVVAFICALAERLGDWLDRRGNPTAGPLEWVLARTPWHRQEGDPEFLDENERAMKALRNMGLLKETR